MSRTLLSLSALAALLGGTAIADVPRVAADIAPVHSLVARVMDGVGTPDLIIPPGESPHGFNMRPSSAEALQEAGVVFWIGHDLTPQLEDAIETLAGNASVTELLEADGITLLDFRESALFEAHDHDHGAHDDHGHDDHGHEEAKADDHDHDHGHEEANAENRDHDHDHGHEEASAEGHDHDHDEAKAEDHDHDHDHAEAKAEDHDHDHDHASEAHADHDDHDDHAGHDHGDHDPHAWLSPQNASVWLNVIAAQLSAADPDNAGAYFANAAAARAEMDDLVAEVSGVLEPVRGGSFVVFHDAYQYFETAFDFPASGAISIGDASDPGPARIAEIQDRIRDEGIDCVLAEPQFNPGLVTTVMDGTESNTSVIDPLGADLEPGPALYPQLIRNMANALAACF